MIRCPIRTALLAFLIAIPATAFTGDADAPAPFGLFASKASAAVVVRRHGTAAGVARRTTRRVIRRSTIYVSTLPAHCVKVSFNGIGYWHCGGQYYQHYNGRYVVVYIN